MDWQKEYQSKKMTAAEAIQRIRSGDQIVISQGVATPDVTLAELAAHKDNYRDISIFNIFNLSEMKCGTEEMKGHFRGNTSFVTGTNREGVDKGYYDYTCVHFSQVPGMIGKEIGADVAILAMSPPDAEGYCSLGLSVDYALRASQVAKTVIAEVNDQMPYVYGDSRVHVSQIDCVVEVSYPIPQLPLPKISEVEEQIGKYCASLIEDGDTLQLGIGAIPDAVLHMLHDKKDLGIHSEMFSDGVVELMEKGIINNCKKELNPGKSVATFLMGSNRLYEFVNNNPQVELYPVDYTNDPVKVMQLEHIVSINSCLQVDLTGQVNAESIGRRQYSGVGGQADFVRGAMLSKYGKSIIAIPSTSKKGQISRIVPTLDPGSVVTTTRNDVRYIITEYGIADLWGKTLRERARALIAIAHPNFREGLAAEFEARFGEKYE